MRLILSAALYTALTLGANADGHLDVAAVSALREGDMRKLVIHAEPQRGSQIAFEDETGAPLTTSDFDGYTVLNFWATWCAPCRHEMPQLSQLQAELGGEAINVVTVATGRNPVPAMRAFFEEIGVDNLPLYRDPTQRFARDFGVLGLPITLILDPEGREIARLQGDADWASDSAFAVTRAIAQSATD